MYQLCLAAWLAKPLTWCRRYSLTYTLEVPERKIVFQPPFLRGYVKLRYLICQRSTEITCSRSWAGTRRNRLTDDVLVLLLLMVEIAFIKRVSMTYICFIQSHSWQNCWFRNLGWETNRNVSGIDRQEANDKRIQRGGDQQKGSINLLVIVRWCIVVTFQR